MSDDNIRCQAVGCKAEIRFGYFCPFHWRLLPAAQKRATRGARGAEAARALAAARRAIEEAQFGPRLL
jgi:hypothetical protein